MSLINSFLKEVQEAANRTFPQATTTYQVIRSTHLYFRAVIDEDTFIDIYFNPDTGRKDFALIHQGDRVYGTDNLQGWHYHPFNDADRHIPCQEPSAKDVFQEMKKITEMIRRHFT
ncbi:hypothetical protein KJ693_04315 [bacterium]|nr:hypothetical protein [bacterium]MBU1614518.1 hypothetical protein [bacterium]